MYAVETAAALMAQAATATDPTTRVRLLGRTVLVLAHVDHTELAVAATARLAAHTSDPDPLRRFVAQVGTGIAAHRAGDPSALAVLVDAEGTYVDAGLEADPLCLELMIQNVMHRLRPEEVSALVGPNPELRLPDDQDRCRVLTMLGIADAWAGHSIRGYVTLLSARDLAITLDMPEQRAEAAAVLTKVAALRGRIDAATAHLDEARRYAAEAGSEFVARGISECQLTLHLATGDRQSWLATLELLVGAGDGAASGLQCEYVLELATARRDDGHRQAARALLAGLTDPPPIVPGGAVLTAWHRWLSAPGDAVARAAFVEAATAPDRPAAWAQQGRALWLLGEEAVRDGRPAAAIALLERAARIYAAVGAVGLMDRVLRLLDSVSSASASPPAAVAAAAGERELTATETAVAVAISDGLTNRETADRLHLSVKTIEFHLGNAYRKLGVRNRTELAVRLAPRR